MLREICANVVLFEKKQKYDIFMKAELNSEFVKTIDEDNQYGIVK